MSTIAPTIIAPWSSAPMRPLDMPQDPLIYPVAFSHFSDGQNRALSQISLAHAEIQHGCPVQCLGCGVSAQMPDAFKTMEFERVRALAYGIERVNHRYNTVLTPQFTSLFDGSEPLYYHSQDQHGHFVNFYHVAEAMLGAIGSTYITTSGWPIGDNFMHSTMLMVADNFASPASPIHHINYSVKTTSKRARFYLDQFIDRCLRFLFSATDEDITRTYKDDADFAHTVRIKFGARWTNDPTAFKNTLRDIAIPHAVDARCTDSSRFEWIFKPFLTELFQTRFFTRMAENIKHLQKLHIHDENEKTSIIINFLDMNRRYALEPDILRFEYFLGKEFLLTFLRTLGVESYTEQPYTGIGKALSNFGLSTAPDVYATKSLRVTGKMHLENRDGYSKVPYLFFKIDSEGFIQFYFAGDRSCLFRSYLSAEDFINYAKENTGEERERCEALATLAGRNVFPDLDKRP